MYLPIPNAVPTIPLFGNALPPPRASNADSP